MQRYAWEHTNLHLPWGGLHLLAYLIVSCYSAVRSWKFNDIISHWAFRSCVRDPLVRLSVEMKAHILSSEADLDEAVGNILTQS